LDFVWVRGFEVFSFCGFKDLKKKNPEESVDDDGRG
jgi:hypothetical protein